MIFPSKNSIFSFSLGCITALVIAGLTYIYGIATPALFIGIIIAILVLFYFHDNVGEIIPKISISLIKRIIEYLNCPLWVRDISGEVIYTNNAFLKIFQEKDSEIKKRMIHLLNPENKFHSEEEFPLNGYIFFAEELRVTSTKFIGYLIDKTEINQLSQSLDIALSSQKNLLNASNLAVAIYASDTRLQYYNDKFVDIWKLEKKWLDQSPSYGELLDYLRLKRQLPEQADFASFKRQQLTLFRNHKDNYKELLHLPNGSSYQVTLLPYDLGGLMFFYEDMVPQLSLQRSYNTLAAIYKTTLNSINDGAAIFDESGKIIFYNQQYLKMWGISQSFAETKPHISELLEQVKSIFSYPEGKWTEYKKDFIASIKTKEITRQKVNLVNGRVVKRFCVPLPDSSHLITYVDVTASVNNEKRLSETNNALQQSHMLKNQLFKKLISELKFPLSKINNHLKNFENEVNNEVQRKSILDINEDLLYLYKVIDDIQDLASIEAGRKKLEVNLFDFNSIMISLIPYFQEKARDLNIVLSFDHERDMGIIIADEKRMKGVIQKLIMRSMEIVGSSGKMHISCTKNFDSNIVMDIHIASSIFNDIPIMDNIETIFVVNDVKQELHDLGFSLLMIKGFIELHGGLFKSEVNGNEIIMKCLIPKGNAELVSLLKQDVLLENA